jgi:hypothetical protein
MNQPSPGTPGWLIQFHPASTSFLTHRTFDSEISAIHFRLRRPAEEPNRHKQIFSDFLGSRCNAPMIQAIRAINLFALRWHNGCAVR